ncbi:MAG TPA: ferrochelatase [Rudaea sp.]|nr:ferrochelatase [Rudaea sp.]
MPIDNVARPSRTAGATAILLLNLGTPTAPTPAAVRRYLAEFLSDPRVIDYPRWLWLPILHGVILRVRPRRSARAYAKIWTPQGSPLLVYTRALAKALGEAYARDGIEVAYAMRYGEPATASVVAELCARGVRRLLVLPLYPQYSATSTATALDEVFAALRAERAVPEIRTIGDYHAAPAYIEALAVSVEEYRRAHGTAQHLLLSFHGIPERYARNGDPYPAQCKETARLLGARLGLGESAMSFAFQSRVGREPWIQPYTDERLVELAANGVRNVQVLCPGFAVDCLETLEEIAMQNAERFLAAGGERFDYIPALNAGAAHVRMLRTVADAQLRGWSPA